MTMYHVTPVRRRVPLWIAILLAPVVGPFVAAGFALVAIADGIVWLATHPRRTR